MLSREYLQMFFLSYKLFVKFFRVLLTNKLVLFTTQKNDHRVSPNLFDLLNHLQLIHIKLRLLHYVAF